MKNKNFVYFIEFPGGNTKYGKQIAKQLNISYIGLRGSYSKKTQQKYYIKNDKNNIKDIDFFYSGKINNKIISIFEKIKKDTKLKIIYKPFLNNKNRKKFINRSKYGLGVGLNRNQHIYSTMRIAFHMSVNLPLFYISKKNFQPHWVKGLIFQSSKSDANENMINLISNYKINLKKFKQKRKKFIIKSNHQLKNFFKKLK